MSDTRRKKLIDKMTKASEPITGSELAEYFDVSRQIIVQDIAILRASGFPITATSNGYLIQTKKSQNKVIKTFVSKHDGYDRMEEELRIIVEYGGVIIDVIAEHPVYGEIVGRLDISTFEGIDRFVEKVKNTDAKPLSSLTKGDHIHTIEVPSDKIFTLIMQELKEKGFVD